MNIVIYGAGYEAEKVFYRLIYKDGNILGYVIDRFIDGEFHGKPIYKIDEAPNIDKYFIVVACRKETYIEIRYKLISLGLTEFDDFIWYRYIDKRICLINANCLGDSVAMALERNEMFQTQFCVYPLEMISSRKNAEIGDKVLAKADIYIHQSISVDNNYGYKFSDEYCLKRLKDDCKTICIPNLWAIGDGIYQTQSKNQLTLYNIPLFYEDSLIDEGIELYGCDDEESVIEYVLSYNFNKNQVQQRFKQMMEKIELHEQKWDIKISSYMIENYKKFPILNDIGHPSVMLIKYICVEVMSLLSLNYNFTDLAFFEAIDVGSESFVWPNLGEALGLEYKQDLVRIRSNRSLKDFGGNVGGVDIREFICEYIYIKKTISNKKTQGAKHEGNIL